MVRFLSVILLVAGISSILSNWERAQGERPPTFAWVRTVDGWERAAAVDVEVTQSVPPALHPALVAGFELGCSLFALLAFPHANLQSRSS